MAAALVYILVFEITQTADSVLKSQINQNVSAVKVSTYFVPKNLT